MSHLKSNGRMNNVAKNYATERDCSTEHRAQSTYFIAIVFLVVEEDHLVEVTTDHSADLSKMSLLGALVNLAHFDDVCKSFSVWPEFKLSKEFVRPRWHITTASNSNNHPTPLWIRRQFSQCSIHPTVQTNCIPSTVTNISQIVAAEGSTTALPRQFIHFRIPQTAIQVEDHASRQMLCLWVGISCCLSHAWPCPRTPLTCCSRSVQSERNADPGQPAKGVHRGCSGSSGSSQGAVRAPWALKQSCRMKSIVFAVKLRRWQACHLHLSLLLSCGNTRSAKAALLLVGHDS